MKKMLTKEEALEMYETIDWTMADMFFIDGYELRDIPKMLGWSIGCFLRCREALPVKENTKRLYSNLRQVKHMAVYEIKRIMRH